MKQCVQLRYYKLSMSMIRIIMIIQQKQMGKKIQNYSLQNVVGQGQFGKVYRAVNEKTQQIVAIKVIKIEKFKMSPKLQQFTINQIQTLSKIQDTTNIVKFIQILKTANNYYFVYEFCNGGTLEQLIHLDGHFTQQKAINFFKDLLKAFTMLAKNNIMHRDIKPSNILIHNGIIKLADFGFCKPLKDARDLAQTMLGSPIYMAPEILKGQVYTMKADIWSLGVVLYEMLFGYCPFQQKTIARLISLIDEGSVDFPSHIKVSKNVLDLLKRMLVKDQFKRITWEELFEYQFTVNTPLLQSRGKSPFMKKQLDNSSKQIDSGKQVQNALKLSPHLLSQAESQNRFFGNNRTQNYFNSKNPKIRKHEQSPYKQNEKRTEKRIIKELLDKRAIIYKGFKMVQEYFTQSTSKTTVNICCYIVKKIKSLSRQIFDSINKISNEKQNYATSPELRKLLNVIIDQKNQIDQKIHPFETELNVIAEPQDIVYMRYADEESLTHQKEGLLQLLQIDDFLHGLANNYTKFSKKQLLEEYEKRVIRKK